LFGICTASHPPSRRKETSLTRGREQQAREEDRERTVVYPPATLPEKEAAAWWVNLCKTSPE